jgi:hypothetical protein
LSSEFPFPYDVQVHVVAGDRFEVALYARDKKKYRRVRELGIQSWQDAPEQEITADHFYMLVACIQRRKRGTRGLVGLGT